MIGASVYGPDNASIGEIGDVLIAPDGKIRAVVVSVGGFLGTADKDIAIPFQALSITRGPAEGAIDKIKVSYSKQQLNDAPRFAFDQPANTTTGKAALAARRPRHRRASRPSPCQASTRGEQLPRYYRKVRTREAG